MTFAEETSLLRHLLVAHLDVPAEDIIPMTKNLQDKEILERRRRILSNKSYLTFAEKTPAFTLNIQYF